ncbi:FG-GAP-like repeat-containing protein [Hymenobacter negativus]|uniref:FG-GAP repeat protein n=1 Tax=Hymenobacter negativus TaxID=2795026 RepID=A0ABS3QGJ0_9BACT|nr:FG-GAP-like repeat-containing protein [Hymenobacter negativus]MBO2010351.1 FG-GAP repeat protein [Hymenobacter negativus]
MQPAATEAHATYQYPHFAVDFDNTTEGVRQTYRLARRPAGTGPVEVQLAVHTALRARQTSPGEVAFAPDSAGAAVLTYNSLKAWDADGSPLAAHLRLDPAGQALALVVDDAGARYPLTIDPLASTAGTTITGVTAGDSYATAVAHIGDINNDGYGDVAVGAPNATGPGGLGAGKAYVYLGSSTGHATSPLYTFEYGEGNGHFGTSVAGAGDYNGDGYGDMLVGEPGFSGNKGRVLLFYGSAGGFSSVYALGSGNADGQMGTSVAGLGDVNGDGYDDIGFGMPLLFSNAGGFYVYLGRTTLGFTGGAALSLGGSGTEALGSAIAGAGDVNGDGYADFMIGAPGSGTASGTVRFYSGGSTLSFVSLTRGTASDRFGASLTSAGDTNGDGYADFLIGAPGVSSGAGAAHYYLGSSTSITAATNPTTMLTGTTAGDAFGQSLSGASDVNGDGYADFAVGAPGVSSNTGRVYYYGGTATAATFVLTQTLNGGAAGDRFGGSISGGDANGDGYGDLLVGAAGYSSSTGRSYTYYGSPGQLAASAPTNRSGESTNDYFACSVAGAGDVNGDGFADVVIGAYNNGNKGRAYVYYGSATGLSAASPDIRSGEAGNNYFGYSVAGTGDVNGDGYADIVIGAYGNSNKGRAYVYYGSSTGLSATGPAIRSGEVNGDNFGYSVAGAGDVNSDGYADLVVGAYGNATSTGKVYVYYGSSAGLSTASPDTRLGEATNDAFGYSVAGTSDVNGDGFADIVVGARGNATNTGRAYVYYGGPAGLRTATPATCSGEATNNFFGTSVAGAGDVNGDGFTDVVIGASGNATNTGKAYVYYGSATGLNTASPATRLGEATSNFFAASVAGAGDVDGDGYGDVVIGAYGNTTNTGRSYLYYGSETGLSTASPDVRSGEASNNYFGASVAGAGDVNGDGYADVLVGAYANTTNTGRSYLYYGNDALGRTARLRLLNTDLSTPLQPAANYASTQFGIGLVARPVGGRSKVRVVWEAVGNGTNFSHNSPLANSTAYTGRGAWTSQPATTATELKALVTKVRHVTRVRARLEYAGSPLSSLSPTNGTGGAGVRVRYGPWQYVGASFVAGSNQATPLPVELTAFAAEAVSGPAVRLTWTTASEKNSARFEIERSADGQQFSPIGEVAAQGTKTSPTTYAYLDSQVPRAANYYRLRQVDRDGTASYSPVRVVAFNATSRSVLALFPNPARATTLNGAAPGAAVQVFDGLGRVVATATADATGTAALVLPARLPGGIYLVRADKQTIRLVVE